MVKTRNCAVCGETMDVSGQSHKKKYCTWACAETARKALARRSRRVPKGDDPEFSPRDRRRFYEHLLGDPCVYCGGEATDLDHIEARVNGGIDDWTNIAPVCGSCNSAKCSRSMLEYLANQPHYSRIREIKREIEGFQLAA